MVFAGALDHVNMFINKERMEKWKNGRIFKTVFLKRGNMFKNELFAGSVSLVSSKAIVSFRPHNLVNGINNLIVLPVGGPDFGSWRSLKSLFFHCFFTFLRHSDRLIIRVFLTFFFSFLVFCLLSFLSISFRLQLTLFH